MRTVKRLWWVAPSVLAGSPASFWHLEQFMFAEGNGALGGLLGLIVGGLGGQLAEQLIGRR
jgi:hypothetical protein